MSFGRVNVKLLSMVNLLVISDIYFLVFNQLLLSLSNL